MVSRWRQVRNTWDRLALYLPVILMGVLALGTYWLARNTPAFFGGTADQRPVLHEPDYFMRGFAVKTFEPNGRLRSEIFGTVARHYPDTDTLEIDNPRIRSFDERGLVTVATAERGLSNADGSEVQLMGDAVVTREPAPGSAAPRLEFQGEFLHVFVNSERVKSHKPVTLIRGSDQFTADQMDYDNLDRVMQLQGRVRGRLMPDAGRQQP
ncbi:MAG TPA: LPS export ABC transporter periplasmic protein LptC [Ramlibacter sp.]|jgi:lipopolysaccharide export system protein LptC|uniref:LPS export ABC transporter periplasmic protein LptC n=1 Tax=Ramlibacter sp. TaxID=1917967 RepID=UPI002D4DF82E|nr:LPS export ABC transporter periplasmic protein LptC [Ramlibacter sp.]HZY17196.1 LPS export ABC transporter periplasmic protein LptC [Ramlibacter sp.]